MPHNLNHHDKTVQFLLPSGRTKCLLHASNLLHPSSWYCVSLECSISFSYRKVLAALTSEASLVITLLDTAALCYNIIRSNLYFRTFNFLTLFAATYLHIHIQAMFHSKNIVVYLERKEKYVKVALHCQIYMFFTQSQNTIVRQDGGIGNATMSAANRMLQ
jgi:hypothetical protein